MPFFNCFNSQKFLRQIPNTSNDETMPMTTLRSSDGETLEVDEIVAMESPTIQRFVQDNLADTVIPLPDVTSTILSKVMEYCQKHVEARGDQSSEDELRAWDLEFVRVDMNTLFRLILAANYLHIRSLLDLTCQAVADIIKRNTPEKIRKIFNLNDLTPDEEEEIRREYPWAFE